MTDLRPFICGACRDDRHAICRGAEHACECPHLRTIERIPTTAPTSAATHAPQGPPAAGVGGEAGSGGAGEVAPGPGRSFPRPDWWGEAGCRYDGKPGHVCLDVWGRPLDGSHPCIAECRAAMGDLMDRYRTPGELRIKGIDDVAARIAAKLGTFARAVGE